MTDLDLLALGGIVSFIFGAGIYIYSRERFTAVEAPESQPKRESLEAAEPPSKEAA